MIAMSLSLLLMAVIGYAFLGARQSFRTMDTLSRLQENARFVFETLAYDLRMAGFAGCSSVTQANVLNNATDWDKDLFGQPLLGYEEGVDGYPSGVLGYAMRGDALSVLRAASPEYIVANHNPAAAQLQLTANHDIKQGEILVITDCIHSAVFQMTNVNNNNTISTIVHNTGNAVSPGNCTKDFGNPVPNPCTANGTAYTYAPGSRILRLNSTTYFVGINASNEPALYRAKLAADSGNAANTQEEIVEGVEDMQIVYGEDTTADRSVDGYVTADAVGNWANVLSVRISLLMASRQDENITSKPLPYTYNGATVTPNDRLLRKVFTSTISLRNRL